jgi:hypothetical protein
MDVTQSSVSTSRDKELQLCWGEKLLEIQYPGRQQVGKQKLVFLK